MVHETKGNVEAILIFQPPPERPPLIPRISSFVEKWLPPTIGHQVMGAVATLLFSLLFIPLLALTTWMFLLLNERFAGSPFVGVGYSVAILLELGIVIGILGDPVTQTAVKILMSIASLFKPASPFKQESSPTTKVHNAPAAAPAPPPAPPTPSAPLPESLTPSAEEPVVAQ